MIEPRPALTVEPQAPTHVNPLLGGRPVAALIVISVLVATVTLLLPSTPTYDPWAWIIWGREIADGHLNTRHGPSWKPLPVLFTTLFAHTGEAAPALWLVVARAGALLALAMAWRLASRLAGGGRAGVAAGTLAVVALVASEGWFRNAALGNSEGLLVAFTLWAVESHLDGRRHHAFAIGFAAGLLRPEVWPFLGLYALYLWVREPRRRPLVAGLLALLPVLWLAPELWGSGDLMRASERAQQPKADSPAFAKHPALEVLRQAGNMTSAPVQIAALLALALGLQGLRRNGLADRHGRVVVALGAGAAAWLGLVAVMTELGYSGNTRYLVPYAAVVCVLGGLGLVRAALFVGPRLGRGIRTDGRLGHPALARAAAGLAVVAAAAPFLVSPARSLSDQADEVRREAGTNRELTHAVRDAGGADKVLSCGQPATGPFYVPVLAWNLGLHVEQVYREPALPGVVFRAGIHRPPPAPGPRSSYRAIAGSGRWRVLAACAPSRRLQVAVPGAEVRRRGRVR